MHWLLLPLLILGAIMMTASTLNAAANPRNKPNLVLFIADDLTWGDIGPNGSTEIRTPNFDRVAKEGMNFKRAFSASPTCTPSRSAIYTGMYPMHNGAHANHSWINEGIRTWPEYFHDIGYRVVLAGKTHIGPREQFPFEYLPDSNIMPPGKDGVLWTDLNTKAVDHLLASHDQSKPLCLIVCSHSPHVYWMDADGYDPATLKLPPYLIDTPETRADRAKYDTDVSHLDQQVGQVLDSLDRHGYADNTLFMFTADHGAQWPFAKWNLYDLGLRMPFLVRWPGHLKPGSSTDAMISLIDILPTMLDAAGGKPPEGIDGRSFMPVLNGHTDRFRDAVYQTHTGDAKMNRSPMRGVRTDRYHYILNLLPDTIYQTHIDKGIAADGQHYWKSWVRVAETSPAAAGVIHRYQHRPPDELYDVQADPNEQHNLATDPAHAKELSRLQDMVKQWRIEQGEDLNKVPMPEDGRKGPLLYAK
jgi:arylsulfatase A-like enzyme